MKNIENSECLTDFGIFIKKGREAHGLYQSDIASRLGISQVYYSHIERGLRNVDLVMALKICRELNLDMNDYVDVYLK